jgi:hypothetical protein
MADNILHISYPSFRYLSRALVHSPWSFCMASRSLSVILATHFTTGRPFDLAAVCSGLLECPLLDSASQNAVPLLLAEDCHVQDCVSLQTWPFPMR